MITELNERLFWILNAPRGDAADAIMILFTITGYTVPAVGIGFLAMYLYGGLVKKNVILLAVTLLLGGGVVHAIKQVYVADRPLGYFAEKYPGMEKKVHAPFKRPHHRTFPSGHSQTVFGVAALISLLFRRHLLLWFTWAFLGGLSRVYLGVHFPIDVLFGAVIGALAAYSAMKVGEMRNYGEEGG